MYCSRHGNYRCTDYYCRQDAQRASSPYGSSYGDNQGALGINSEGDLTIGLGNGLTVDLDDGSLGIDVGGGFSVDTDY